MSRSRTRLDRVIRLLPDPQGVADGLVVTTTSYTDSQGQKQYTYDLETGGGGGGVEGVTGVSPITVDNTDPLNPVVEHDASGASAGSYTSANITIDADGHVTAAADGSSSGVASVTGTAPIAVDNTDPVNPVVGHDASGVSAGSYTSANITVDADGHVTAAADGSGGGGGHSPGSIFSNGDLLLTGTLTSEIQVPYAGTITDWTIVGDVAGSASIIVSHATYAAYDTMTTLFTAVCSSAIKATDTGLTDALSAGDILRFSASGFADFTRCSIVLTVS